jgi:hypothetical protein
LSSFALPGSPSTSYVRIAAKYASGVATSATSAPSAPRASASRPWLA